MTQRIALYKPTSCPLNSCPGAQSCTKSGSIVRHGSFYRSSDAKRVNRYFCRDCQRSFSSASTSPCFRQKKRHLNHRLKQLLCSQVSLRRSAKILCINPKTVTRKFLFLAQQAELRHTRFLNSLRKKSQPLSHLYFDEMETVEKTKCLPLSLPILVEPRTRKILGIAVASMPAKGPLAKMSVQKYGYRIDEREETAQNLFKTVSGLFSEKGEILSDRNPKYPKWIRSVFPDVTHRTVKGRRGCVTGQGELKSGGYDPLFPLNHTCAMLRANVNRLTRKTWCITQRPDRLYAHLMLYIDFHNWKLTQNI